MKKTWFCSLLGVTALISAAASSYGQGKINLNNYSSSGNQILYGAGWGILSGTGLQNGTPSGVTWSIGFYYALGDVTASITPDPSGLGTPSGGGLSLATGAAGDTTTIKYLPGGGYFTSTSDAIINGWTAGSVTFEVVAYSGANYASSAQRGHSAAFLITPVASTAPQSAPQISTSSGGMPSFAINIPEPTTFALAGIGSAAFLFFRRKQA